MKLLILWLLRCFAYVRRLEKDNAKLQAWAKSFGYEFNTRNTAGSATNLLESLRKHAEQVTPGAVMVTTRREFSRYILPGTIEIVLVERERA